MLWLSYAFFGVILAMGVVGWRLLAKVGERRAWLWLLMAIIGATGLAGLLAGRTDGHWRTLSMGAVFCLIGADHLFQYAKSRSVGAPRKLHLAAGLAWVLLGTAEVLSLPGLLG